MWQLPRCLTTGVSQRVRRPDIVQKWRRRNLITVAVLFLTIGGIFYLTLAKVQQDTFEDLDEKGNPRVKTDSK
jgi:hypothetical protein